MGIIADVAALARAGYTMADIRELMQTKEPDEAKGDPKPIETPKEDPKSIETPKEDPKPEPKDDKIDYKAEYEKLIAKQQADNRKQNFGGEPDNRTDEQKAIDILAAIF